MVVCNEFVTSLICYNFHIILQFGFVRRNYKYGYRAQMGKTIEEE